MDREQLFGKTLEKIKRLAKEQGNCVSREQIREAFAELGLEPGQQHLLFQKMN